MRHLCKVLCLAGLVLLYGATSAQAQQGNYHKLICRGGEDAFRIDDSTDENNKPQLQVNFSPSSHAPGKDVWNLDPGTCSWVNRVLADGEPQQIQLYVTPDVAQRIRTHLNSSSDNFWQFFIRDTERGYYETRSHQQLIITTKKH